MAQYRFDNNVVITSTGFSGAWVRLYQLNAQFDGRALSVFAGMFVGTNLGIDYIQDPWVYDGQAMLFSSKTM